MFQKVHLRLAVLCGSITAFILLAMSLGYLYISEQGLKTSNFSSFRNDMNTLITNLEHQNVITHEWLTKMEGDGKYRIHITDNGVPFLFNERETEEENEWDTYKILANRTIVESKAYEWCQRFSKLYPYEWNIAYEDENFVCYYFKQGPNCPYNLAFGQENGGR